ncbi:uncharacterized protein LOC107876595 [Capsicum annuum]|uniref:uncharacterized protein LOC107876595 n=1 Tax=Capsicum annuum TaxID=4072 RepID=UPI001FB131FD|nr:uncharacterized protein LOC107876595 [Capsicum annuum]
MGKGGVEDVIEVDDESKEECPVESGKLDGSDDASEIGKEKEKELTINVPLVEALEQIPGYAKFMKDLVTRAKKADPGAFSSPCTIGSLNFPKALCNLEKSINLMLLAVYIMLGLGDPTPKNILLVMADRSIKRPVGILHDVLVKVSDIILSANFVVLDCEVDFEVPIILGRPFLTTGRVVLDIDLNELKFRFNDKEANFKMHSSITQQKEMSVFSIMDMFYEDGKEVAAWCLDEV